MSAVQETKIHWSLIMIDTKYEVSPLRKFYDKLVRKITGKLEKSKEIEIDRLVSIYKLYFPELPEIFNLGEDYSNRLELSVQSFRLEYWTRQLKGYFYSSAEKFITVMCSYEFSKMQAFVSGYTDDPVHLFFHVLKQWAVKISNTHFDESDINEARNWQMLIKDLITQDVFKASSEDSRQQVLFELEETLENEIIPYLIYYRENKSALEQLKTVSAHLAKFFNHAIKYLFYIGRDSEYCPNFSYDKLLSLGNNNKHMMYNLTRIEQESWGKLKETVPLKLLLELVKKDSTIFTQMSPFSISMSNVKDIVSTKNITIDNNNFTSFQSSFLKKGTYFDYQKDYYARHIDLTDYVNTHVFLQELTSFRLIFSAAQQCAELGGNLLAFGLLRGQLCKDINDCLQCLHVTMLHIKKLERNAWTAYKEIAFKPKNTEPNKYYASENWKKNYSQSAQNYFRQLEEEHQFCKNELSLLAAAANKKTTQLLIEETQQKIDIYLKLHNEHSQHREKFLYDFNTLNMNLLISSSQKNQILKIDHGGIKIRPKDSFKEIKNFCFQLNKYNENSKEKNELYQQIQSKRISLTKLCQDENATDDMYYYASRACSLSANNQSFKQKEQENLETLLKKNPAHVKGHYRLSQFFKKNKNIDGALNSCQNALQNFIETYSKTGMNYDDNKFFKKLKKHHEELLQEKQKSPLLEIISMNKN